MEGELLSCVWEEGEVGMTDREKVIKELECCVSLKHNGPKCANCDYADEFHNGDCETYLLSDALALLKAQEPVKPEMIMYTGAGIGISNCPRCGYKIDEYHNDKFCGSCGQAVKWK